MTHGVEAHDAVPALQPRIITHTQQGQSNSTREVISEETSQAWGGPEAKTLVL